MSGEHFTADDIERIGGIASELEHLPPKIRRHFDQDGRDARFLRILQGRLTKLSVDQGEETERVEACRREFGEDRGFERCGKPAKYIVWGKLFPPECLGPRCEDCAHEQLDSLYTSWYVRLDQVAIYRLQDSEERN